MYVFHKFYLVLVYLTIHNMIRYTIYKNEKMIHDMFHVLKIMHSYIIIHVKRCFLKLNK